MTIAIATFLIFTFFELQTALMIVTMAFIFQGCL